jgi:hypothetical protein
MARLPAVIGGRPRPPAEYRGPKGVPPGRLRRGGTHRFDAATVRWCGSLVRGARWCPCWSRGRRRHRLGLGAAGREGRGEGGLHWGRKGLEGALTRNGWTATLWRESVVGRAAPVPDGRWWASSTNGEEGGQCAWARTRVQKRGKRGLDESAGWCLR